MEVNKTKMSEVLPFIIMVIMEGWTIGLTIFAKTAITNGMSPLMFIVYTNALATPRGQVSLFLFSFLLMILAIAYCVKFFEWRICFGSDLQFSLFCTERRGHLLLSLCSCDSCSSVL